VCHLLIEKLRVLYNTLLAVCTALSAYSLEEAGVDPCIKKLCDEGDLEIELEALTVLDDVNTGYELAIKLESLLKHIKLLELQ